MQGNPKQLIERIEERTVICDTLHETDMMLKHGPVIWKAKSFIGNPHFYPVYRYEDMYSYSLLALIIKKRNLALDQKVLELVRSPGFTCVMSNQVLDREITRIGSAHNCGFSITDVDIFAHRIIEALKADIALVEQANPEYTNVVLCGGKDSLNLLLLPWKNQTIAISADPNYAFVKEFVERNELKIRVLKLEDEYDIDELNDEIMEGCCRVDLAHWRWGASLRRLAQDMNKKLIFWKGQAGDLYMSTTWKVYMHPVKPVKRLFRRIYSKASEHMPFPLARAIGHNIQPSVINTTWNRTASLQGSHMGFIREIADCLTVSAYHGPSVMKVWEEADLASVAQHDMRPLIGRMLLGRDVVYPSANPGPIPSLFRNGISTPEHFLDLLKQTGISIRS